MLEKIRGQIKQMNDDGIEAKLQVTSSMTGGPALIIADAAATASADVIVTGTRGHTALAGILLGSVAQRLLHVARCPVLVVPDRAAGAASDPATYEAAAVN